MESVNAQLYAVKEKFPGLGDRIEKLYESDEDFRTLCTDYILCIQHFEKFKKEFSEKYHTVEEYKDIRSELERELFDLILRKDK